MKLRHSILGIFMTSILFSLSFSNCDNDKSTKIQESIHNKIQEQETAETQKIEKNSLENFQLKIEEFSEQIEYSSENIKKLESSVKDLDALRFWVWISLGLSGLAIILSLITISKSSTLKGAIEDLENRIRDIGNGLQNDILQFQQVSRNYFNNEVEQLKRRVLDLENQIRQKSAGLNTERLIPPIPEPIPSPQQQIKKGYFANPINGATPYFKKLLQYKEPEARFSAEISNNKAVFRPFEEAVYFNTYTSFIDDYRAAIEFSGCDPKQASKMEIIKKGYAELRDNNWYITKKALVKLS